MLCREAPRPEILALYAGKSLLACRINKQTKKQKLEKKKKGQTQTQKGRPEQQDEFNLLFMF